VSEPARRVYYEPVRPLSSAATAGRADVDRASGADGRGGGGADGRGRNGRDAGELNISDVLGKRIVAARLAGSVTVREENALAALEVMSRFAIDPRWLVYLPPTMSPTATSAEPGLLEHPAEALGAYRSAGVAEVICQEKHMGSRAVLVACRDDAAALRRFGLPGPGVIFTRTGRAFFADPRVERELLGAVIEACETAGLWQELATDWLVLDCELLPWSAKAGDLLRTQYAPVAVAAEAALSEAAELARAAVARGVDAAGLLAGLIERQASSSGFAAAYRRYCWPVSSIADLRLAPFQILAGEGAVHALRPHAWHLERLGRLCDSQPGTFRRTAAVTARPGEAESEAATIAWWEELTAVGGEGMVVKPASVVHRGSRGLAQPGIKCRGPEYLRLVYGPEYLLPANLTRLRSRNVGHKRSLAVREFALGIEALERFVAGEPLYRVHECVFGVLALESEAVDPRL
jgi:protein phosphatase